MARPPFKITFAQLLANDLGTNLELTEVQDPTRGGSITVDWTNKFIEYVPPAEDIGYDEFRYKIAGDSGRGCVSQATVRINVPAPIIRVPVTGDIWRVKINSVFGPLVELKSPNQPDSGGVDRVTLYNTWAPDNYYGNDQSGVTMTATPSSNGVGPENICRYMGSEHFSYIFSGSIPWYITYAFPNAFNVVTVSGSGVSDTSATFTDPGQSYSYYRNARQYDLQHYDPETGKFKVVFRSTPLTYRSSPNSGGSYFNDSVVTLRSPDRGGYADPEWLTKPHTNWRVVIYSGNAQDYSPPGLQTPNPEYNDGGPYDHRSLEVYRVEFRETPGVEQYAAGGTARATAGMGSLDPKYMLEAPGAPTAPAGAAPRIRQFKLVGDTRPWSFDQSPQSGSLIIVVAAYYARNSVGSYLGWSTRYITYNDIDDTQIFYRYAGSNETVSNQSMVDYSNAKLGTQAIFEIENATIETLDYINFGYSASPTTYSFTTRRPNQVILGMVNTSSTSAPSVTGTTVLDTAAGTRVSAIFGETLTSVGNHTITVTPADSTAVNSFVLSFTGKDDYTSSTPHRYWRYEVLKTNDNDVASLSSLEMREVPGGPHKVPVSVTTTEYGAGYEKTKLFDGDAQTFWASATAPAPNNPVTVTFDYGSSPVVIREVMQQARPDRYWNYQQPIHVRISYSDDGTTYSEAKDTWLMLGQPSDKQVISVYAYVPTAAAYDGYRFNPNRSNDDLKNGFPYSIEYEFAEPKLIKEVALQATNSPDKMLRAFWVEARDLNGNWTCVYANRPYENNWSAKEKRVFTFEPLEEDVHVPHAP